MPRHLNCLRSWRPFARPALGFETLERREVLSGFGGGDHQGDGDSEISVLTRNVYVGFDVGPVADAIKTGNPANIVPAVTAAWGMLQSNDFAQRAEALAAEIEETQPLLVGLQEVANIFFNQEAEPRLDYLALLIDALESRGLHYQAVAELSNLDAQFPGITEEGLTFIRLVDRDVILARTDLHPAQLTIENVQTHHFATLAELVPGLHQPRGWAAVDAHFRGETFRFVTTHLEPADEPAGRAVQEAQALELLAGPGNTNLPVIMAGDINSEADPAGVIQQSDSYDYVVAAGFDDLWQSEHPNRTGNTHGFGDTPGFLGDLRDPDPSREQRIDFIFYRGDWDPESAELVGERLRDRTPSGLWPSDHVGVAGTLDFERNRDHGLTVALLGTFSGQTVSAAPTADPATIFVVTEGQGLASYLGSFTMTSPHYSHLDTLQADGTQIITTASGDTLTANFSGQFTPTVDGKLRGVLSATIVGGTGLYSDASGSYLFTLEFDPATFQSTATIVGLLRF